MSKLRYMLEQLKCPTVLVALRGSENPFGMMDSAIVSQSAGNQSDCVSQVGASEATREALCASKGDDMVRALQRCRELGRTRNDLAAISCNSKSRNKYGTASRTLPQRPMVSQARCLRTTRSATESAGQPSTAEST